MQQRKVRVLILTHGGLAQELLNSARTIAGAVPEWMEALSLDWEATFDQARRETEAVIERLGGASGLIILTDMYGGTPFNVARSFRDSPAIRVVAGANLPMVVRLCCLGDSELGPAQLADWLVAKGKRSVCHCSGDLPEVQTSAPGTSERPR